jgi:glutaredoxin-related protein
MKGTPQMPQCGFSHMAVQVLQACGVQQFFTVNVLENPDNPPGHQGVRQLADDSAALRQRRIRRRLGHHERDVRVGRAAQDAGGREASA